MKKKNEAELHSAGSTVRHNSMFENYKSFSNNFELSKDFLVKWVFPFYEKLFHPSDLEENSNDLKSSKSEITYEVVLNLLGEFDWRSRSVGAYFAAIKNYTDVIDIIGIHLLKSEVTYAGITYCLVLASFNTPQSVEYLNRYLEYYLTKSDLYFDQRYAMEAILYLDEINGTNNFEQHKKAWLEFVKDKEYWKEEISLDIFKRKIAVLEEIRNYKN